MKLKLKIYLKTFILIFGISFLLSNCEKENDIIIKQNINKTKFKISKIGKIKIQQNKNLINKLKQNLIKDKSNVQNKAIYSSEHNFTIDTDHATYIENADASYHSYTFVVTREEDKGSLENLLVSLQEDESYKLLLIEYNITKQEKIDFASGKPIDFNNKISYTEINDDGIIEELFTKSGGCEQMFYEPCSSGGNADGHRPTQQNDGSYCSGSDTIIDVSGCGGGSTPDDTSPGESTTSGSNDNESDGGGGGSSSGSTSSSATTSPNPMDITTPVGVLTDIDLAPSCLSFNFESVASNWQASTINEFEFGVGTYTTNGNITSYRIDYGEQPITFEAWETDRFGNALSAGAAAEIAAEAIGASMSNTARHFKDKYGFSETQVRLWFEDNLKNEFSQRADGGRVTFRTNPYNQTPTRYQTTLFFNDNCD